VLKRIIVGLPTALIHQSQIYSSRSEGNGAWDNINEVTEFNKFHNCAFNGYFSSHNTTNRYTYLKCVYHMLFIADMFQSPRSHYHDNLQDYKESK